MNRRDFVKGLAALGAVLGIGLPKPRASELIDNSDPWGDGAIGVGGDDWDETGTPDVEIRTLGVDDYSRQIDFSRRVFVNDDLDAFANIAARLGDKAAQFEDALVAGLVEQKS